MLVTIIAISLAHNIALLVALAAAYRILEARLRGNSMLTPFVSGLVVGGVCVVGMKTPMVFAKGIVFDGCSIVLSVGALFGGPIVAIISAGLSAWYRWYLGGPGAVMGVSVIAEAALFGLLFRYLRMRGMPLNARTATAFGFLVHVGMVGLMRLLPAEIRAEVIRKVAPLVLTWYPLGSTLICMLFLDYERKEEGERQLRLAKERYRTIFDSIGDGVIVTDTEGRVEALNPSAERLTGWKNEEAEGRKLEDIFVILNEESRAPATNPVSRVLKEGIVVGLANHTVLLSRDGAERAIADAGAPVHDDGGRITGVVLVFRDQTEERALERSAEQARRLAEGIVDTIREALLVLDAQLRVRKANQTFYRRFRLEPQEVEGKSFFELTGGRWRTPEIVRLLNGVLLKNTVFNDAKLEMEVPGVGVRSFLLNGRRIYQDKEKTELILLAAEDVTERRRAERAIQLSEQRLRAFLDTSDDLCFLKDSKFRYLVINEANARFFERAPKDIIGLTDFDLMPEEAARRCRQTDEQALAGEGVVVALEPVGGRVFETRKFRVPLEHGEFGIGAVIRDVTEREKATAEIARQLEELKRWQKLTINREQRIEELRQEVNKLTKRLGEPERY